MATEVKLIFKENGEAEYQLPHIQSETGSDLANDKAIIIEGIRGDGSLYIPGGKKSLRIVVRGILSASNYIALTSLMNEMKTKITTSLATLTLKHKINGSWQNDYSYTVRRIGEIIFRESLRTTRQEYEIEFLVLAY